MSSILRTLLSFGARYFITYALFFVSFFWRLETCKCLTFVVNFSVNVVSQLVGVITFCHTLMGLHALPLAIWSQLVFEFRSLTQLNLFLFRQRGWQRFKMRLLLCEWTILAVLLLSLSDSHWVKEMQMVIIATTRILKVRLDRAFLYH